MHRTPRRAEARVFKLDRVLALVLGYALAGPVMAQTYAFNSVAIEGNARIDDATILAYAGIARGETVTAAELNDAAQAIRASGQFDLVEVTPQGSTLAITVRELPVIRAIGIEGNRSIRDEQIRALLGSQERRVYSPAQAEADTAAITQAYANEGQVNAIIRPQIIRRDANTVDLVFEVNESGVSEIERITFVGNRAFNEGRLRRVLETKQAGLLRALVRRDTYSPERLQFDQQVLTDFYNSRGYADFQIQSVDVQLTRERDAYLVTFFVQEGQQFRIGETGVVSEIAGADPAEFAAATRLRSGQIYSPTQIETDIARLETLAIRKGLNFVRVDPRIDRDPQGRLLNVTYALVPGDRIFVERIDIEGNTTTLDRVIRQQFRTVEGDPFNPRAIRESAERIRALGYFANADVNAREGSSPDQVVIDVDVVEQPTGSLSFGANFNSDDGVSLIASFSEDNFLGRGQELAFDVSLGEDRQNFRISFAEPALLGRDLRFTFGASYQTTDNANALFDTETLRIQPGIVFPVSDNGRLGLFYALDIADITGVQGNPTDPPEDRASLLIFEDAGDGRVATQSVGYQYSWDSRRAGLDTSSGIALRFSQEFGVGDANFVKTEASALAQTRVFNDEVTLTAAIEAGNLSYNDGDSRITDRFFLGSRDIRGFESRGIGPRDADTDDALGGNQYAVARLEAQFPLGLPEEYGIRGGVFVDHGAIWDVGDTAGINVLYDEFSARTVAGVSIFWTTPLGPLRFNFTEPLDVRERDKTKDFDLTISTSF